MQNIFNKTDLVEYTSAVKMAAVYKQAIEDLKRIDAELKGTCASLCEAFMDSGYNFNVHLEYHNRVDQLDHIIQKMKLSAWGAIINRLNIRRVMSSKRIDELNRALDGDGTAFPEIDPDNIEDVARGYVQSAVEFLEEAVGEEYDFWRPGLRASGGRYVTNKGSDFRLKEKVIKGWIVERGYNGKFRLVYSNTAHVTALDNIFHMLDDKGPVESFKGPLASAIESSDGTGETEYFKFRCFENGNIHLWIKRKDLLDRFNQIAGKNRLGHQK